MRFETSSLVRRPQSAGLAWWLVALSAGAHAQTTNSTASRIDRVTLYQGSATIERTLPLNAGAREATFQCLPAALDPQSLQVQGDGIKVGEVRVDSTERALSGECASPQDARIRTVEDALAKVNAAANALQLSDSYLKTVATGPTGDSKSGSAPTSAQIQSTAEALRRGLEDSQVRAHQLQREKESLEQRLRALQQEQGRSANGQSKVMRVRVQLASERAASLRLVYQVRGPSWQNTYRAVLDDSQAGTPSVRLERQAIVAQSSGEEWNGVLLRLSTGAPQQSTQGQLPRPWSLEMAPPPQPQLAKSSVTLYGATPQSAPAPMMEAMASAAGDATPDFEVQTQEGAYATEFAVPGRTNVPSSGERITLSLGSTDAPARLLTRTAPAVEPAAYLVAQISRPAGVWPAGPVALLQGTRFIGNGRLNFSGNGAAAADANIAELAFGRDDKVTVRAEPVQDNRGSAGLTGSSTQRTVQSRYCVDNQHSSAIDLQVLHAAPVSRDEKIEVQSRYTPQPANLAFDNVPGTVLWQQNLAAGASASFAAEHVLRYPKDAQLRERR